MTQVNDLVFESIITFRGGIPESCDFCGKLFTEENFATPEEGGDWACIECVRRWEKELLEEI